MVAVALSVIAKDFHIGSDVETEVSLSIFVLAFAMGPLFLAPLSEIFGRALVLQLSALWYLAFNIGCGFCTSKSQLIAFRFLSGLGGSAPLAVSLSYFMDDVAMAQKSLGGWWCCRRLLEARRTGPSTQYLLSCSPSRSCHRSHCWWIHHGVHHLAMGLLVVINRGRRNSGVRLHLFLRNVPSNIASMEGTKAENGNRK